MITYDHDRCCLCKRCVEICHTSCLSLEEGTIHIDYQLCSTCTQCIAYCPTGALTWDGVESREIDKNKLPDAESLLEMFMARRSIRSFLLKPVEREQLERICSVARLAPTNSYDIEVMVIQDRDVIAKLENINMEFIKKVYRGAYAKPLVFGLLRRLSPAINPIDKLKMERTLRRQSIFQKAPVIIMVLGDPRLHHAELSAQYSMYNMILMAQALGIGSCISGAGKRILSRDNRVRELLGIPEGKKILGVLFLGYPAVSFGRVAEGNTPKIHWR